ncbi:phosphoglycerate mutase [Reticulomyxa filosa]|uniref:phosphoglycerate mutase (2,3-diphosphoglycerate-dependent) n=1 Tax=Reticulomyxa filosa TaxID=46433 RepID=X6PGZ4_RETFI|nr:phosphoglycerate mutase [Reticulomyxa filosa]|eukprot:ETO36952.1 phosphoglycerate mutase [Reticulomyxa filosa]
MQHWCLCDMAKVFGMRQISVKEAQEGANVLKKAHFQFDIMYTSYLKRAIKTGNIILETLDQLWIPVQKSWSVNERMWIDQFEQIETLSLRDITCINKHFNRQCERDALTSPFFFWISWIFNILLQVYVIKKIPNQNKQTNKQRKAPSQQQPTCAWFDF